MLKPTILLALSLAAAACNEPAPTDATPRTTTGTTANPGGIWAGNVVVQSTGTGLRVNNNTTRAIGWFAIDAKTAERVRWAPCVTATGCATVAPGETVVPAGEIIGAAQGSDILFYWWHLVPTADGTLQPDSIRSVTVKL